MPFLKEELRLEAVNGSKCVAENLRKALVALGIDCLVEEWLISGDDGPYELTVTDIAGNTGYLTVTAKVHARAITSSDPKEIFRYIVSTLSNFSENYYVKGVEPWCLEVKYLGLNVWLNLEPDPGVFATSRA